MKGKNSFSFISNIKPFRVIVRVRLIKHKANKRNNGFSLFVYVLFLLFVILFLTFFGVSNTLMLQCELPKRVLHHMASKEFSAPETFSSAQAITQIFKISVTFLFPAKNLSQKYRNLNANMIYVFMAVLKKDMHEECNLENIKEVETYSLQIAFGISFLLGWENVVDKYLNKR